MIRSLQVRNFRMLRSNSISLLPFQVLVGQNATGKSTVLGALQLISDILQFGVDYAVNRISPSIHDLCFIPDEPIEFAVELSVPSSEEDTGTVRYEIEIGVDQAKGLRVLRENLFILPLSSSTLIHEPSRSLFGEDIIAVIHEATPRQWRKVVSKTKEGRDYFKDETTSWNNVFRFGPDRAALGALPEDPHRFPLSIAARNALRDGIRTLALDASEMRGPSAPGNPPKLELDGSNLPHVVRDFQLRDQVLFDQWVEHLAMAVEGLETVEVREREEDRYLVLFAKFKGAHKDLVPSWMLSDGTLRLMALTLLSYAAEERDFDTFLVEEPENGLHPLAIQIAFEALSQHAGNNQVLCATHSPIFLAYTALEQALVFRRDADGSAVVRRGPEWPTLREWSERVNVSDLFVTGVLA